VIELKYVNIPMCVSRILWIVSGQSKP